MEVGNGSKEIQKHLNIPDITMVTLILDLTSDLPLLSNIKSARTKMTDGKKPLSARLMPHEASQADPATLIVPHSHNPDSIPTTLINNLFYTPIPIPISKPNVPPIHGSSNRERLHFRY